MASKTLELFFKRAGLQEDEFRSLLEDPAEDAKIEERASGLFSRLWEHLKSSPNYVGPLLEQERAQVNGKWRSTFLSVAGLEDDAQLKALPPKEFIGYAVQRIRDSIKDKLMAETDSELHKQLIAEREKVEQFQSQLKRVYDEEIPKIKQEVESHKRDLTIQSRIQKILGKFKTKVPHDALHKLGVDGSIYNLLKSKYQIQLSDDSDDGLELLDRQTGYRVRTPSETILTARDEIAAFLKSNHLLSDGDDEPAPKETQAKQIEVKIQGAKANGAPYADAAKRHSEMALQQLRKQV